MQQQHCFSFFKLIITIENNGNISHGKADNNLEIIYKYLKISTVSFNCIWRCEGCRFQIQLKKKKKLPLSNRQQLTSKLNGSLECTRVLSYSQLRFSGLMLTKKHAFPKQLFLKNFKKVHFHAENEANNRTMPQSFLRITHQLWML